MPPVSSPVLSRATATIPAQPRLRLEVGKVRMEQQVGAVRHLQPAAAQIGLGHRAGEWLAAFQQPRHLAAVVRSRLYGRRLGAGCSIWASRAASAKSRASVSPVA